MAVPGRRVAVAAEAEAEMEGAAEKALIVIALTHSAVKPEARVALAATVPLVAPVSAARSEVLVQPAWL
jgi:phosphohistidine swiveling domain-containing protein